MKKHTLAIFFFSFSSSAASVCGSFVYEQPRSVTDVVARVQEFYPAGVARPKSEFEAKCALKFARKNGLKVSVKTGGFWKEPLCLC